MNNLAPILDEFSGVFERMFFQPVEPLTEQHALNFPAYFVQANFAGGLSGSLELWIPETEGASLAANFLPEEPIFPEQVPEILSELANMLCGHLVSNQAQGARFHIAPPVCKLHRESGPCLAPALSDGWLAFRIEAQPAFARLRYF